MTAKQALDVLTKAFRQETIGEGTITIYVQKLSDIPGPLLEATIHRAIETCRFFPTIAELRRLAAGLAGLLPPTMAEALAIIRKADVETPILRRDGSYAYTERFWAWPADVSPEALDAVKRALYAAGDPVHRDDRVFAWEKHLEEAYKAIADEQTHRALADLSRAELPSGRVKALAP